MNKKLIALALALIPMLGFSQHRSENDAINVAQEFWGNNVNRTNLKAVSQNTIAKAKARVSAKDAKAPSSSKQSFYVINDDEHNRFVIVSSDDRLLKILGYSDNGVFNPETAPYGLLDMLNEYDGQYANVYAHLGKITKDQQKATTNTVVQPLINSKWNQSLPYNLQCPKDIKSTEGENCVTGCVATAMAQVMNFYKYPNSGTGSHTYTSSTLNINQSMDFSSIHFDWGNMLDEYDDNATETQKTAVATLMHAAGVSVSMDYADVSGAYAIDMAYALSHFWKYNTNIAYKKKQFYSDDVWNQIITEELNAGHPILYAGSGGAGGHQFILDGCDQDGMYHFNFGWSGLGDGYYSLDILNPIYKLYDYELSLGDFSSRQEMVCYVSPNEYGQKNGEFYTYSNLDLSKEKIGSNKFIGVTVFNYGKNTSNTINPNADIVGEIGIGIFDKDFNFLKSLAKSETNTIKTVESLFNYINFDTATFTEGKQYYIAVYAHSDAIGYSIVRTDKGLEDYYLATVKDGYITFEPMKQMGTSTPTKNEVLTGLYNATATCADGSSIDWQINMWQDESDASKYWIADFDPIAKAKGYSYSNGWNKVYGYVNENGNKLSIPVDQAIASNILLRNYSGGNTLTLYLSAKNKTMSIESVWGCEEVKYDSDNTTAKEFSRFNGGRFEYTTEKIDDPDTYISSPFISVSENHILTITCKTDEATIYYTIDGTQPSSSSILYSTPIEIKGNCTIKAVAIKNGKSSDVSTFTISDFICLTPSISQELNSNIVSIKSETDGAKIYYTLDNTTPTNNSILYTKEFEISKSCIVKAIAVKDTYNDSPVATQSVIFYQDDSQKPETGEIKVSGNVAGELSSRISDSDKLSATRWSISGEINGTDIAFIREAFEIGKITDLDLGDAIIVGGGEPYYKSSYLEYSTENNVVGKKMFSEAKSLISLVLPSTTLLIDSYALENCDNLATITIPDICKVVESSAINFCKNLTSIQIGKSLEKFEPMNGNYCPMLKSIDVDANNSHFTSVDGILYSKNKDVIYKYPSGKMDASFEIPATVKVINNYAFSNVLFDNVILPNGLETIGNGAFDACRNLQSIDMPQTVCNIGMFAFQSCAKLSEVKIPDNVQELKSFAFAYCVSLRNCHIGASVSKIDGSTFVESTLLQSFTVDEANKNFATKGGILYSKDFKTLVRCPLALYLDEIILNDDIEVIGSYAFDRCKNIKKIKLPRGLKEIGSSAFNYCSMEAIAVPGSVDKIGMFAFQNCKNLKNFVIPTSTSSVPTFMLAYCDSLEYINIHKDVTHIDSYAFACANKLRTIECWISNISELDVAKGYLGEYTSFKEINSDCTWHVPEGCADAYKAQPWWVSTWNIIDDLKESTNGIDIVASDSDLKLMPGEHTIDIVSSSNMTVNIYNLQGHLVYTCHVKAGNRTTVDLPSGIYIINRKKICIR